MTTEPKVTWLLPSLNLMPYLPETLASIEAQTYRNWEIMAWDNGSTDGTVEELKRWIPSRLPGRVVTDGLMPLGRCLQQMVLECSTEYCARIDGDDINDPTRLEKQVAFLEQNPEIALVGAQVSHIDANGAEYGLYDPMPLLHDDIVHRMLHRWVMWHPTVFFRRSAVLEAGNYHPDPLAEDNCLWPRLAVKHRLANIDEILLKYRVHDASVTQRANAAVREKRGDNGLLRCFQLNGPLLFGACEQELTQLRQRQLGCAIVLLYRIARHLERTQGGNWRARMQSDSYIEACHALIPRRDLVSRAAIAVLKRIPHRGKSPARSALPR